jgi:hypothetical protein
MSMNAALKLITVTPMPYVPTLSGALFVPATVDTREMVSCASVSALQVHLYNNTSERRMYERRRTYS